ncbi:helix-turn-helix domain-containing protein [Leadbettera azotonutricia]|uniref:Transcriptional regulator n=1 Tax=Leadbettera azotonutricia (strain ATCC BAA-888 / DSM 13862 / ZAS-9) TaxID=545695 RepID=F5YCN7_LEAAZ|nr:helix-turn-helix transcriptional regulator [Leadbettera azotonutricia]AEF82426.1 transcriptional regulator [Leadbettera azotonutricia ZAS-9]
MNEIEFFWQRVKQLIKKKKATQAEVARVCGFSLRTFQGWIAKDVSPTVTEAYRLAKVLGVTVEYLMSGKDRRIKDIESRIKSAESLLEQAKLKLDQTG